MAYEITADSRARVSGDEGQPDSTALFEQIKAWYKAATESLATWREQAEEDFAFVAGDQWSEDDRKILKEQLRPEITFNRVGPVIATVAGIEITNRQEIHFYPREVGDTAANDLLSAAAKFFRQESQTEDEESDAFTDCVICGLGATETRMDYELDPDGLIPTERLDPLAVFYDPGATKRNVMDRRYCGYAKQIGLDDAKAMFPDAEEEDLHASWANLHGAGGVSEQKRGADAYQDGGGEKRDPYNSKVTIVYCEWWDREPYWLVKDRASGQEREVTTREMPLLRERMTALGMPVEAVKTTRKVFKSAFVGAKVLKSGPGRCHENFSVNFITGKRDRNAGAFYGLARAMKDPQRWANKFFSQILHIINSNAKGGVMVETGAVENIRKFEDTWADSNSVTWVKDGAIKGGRIQPKPAITYPSGLDKMMDIAVMAIPQTTGVNFELMGLVDREQAGVLERQRKQSGLTILATLFDNLRQYRKTAGAVLLHLIQTGVTPNRLIRIDSENGPRYAPLIADPNIKYDVIVDEATNSVNQKELVWGMLVQMMPILTKQPLPPDLWADILKYSPLPASVAMKIGEKITAFAQQPPPPDPAMLKTQADSQRAAAELRQKARIKEQELALEREKTAAEIQLEREKTAAELQLKREEAAAKMALDRERGQADQRLREIDGDRAYGIEKAKFDGSEQGRNLAVVEQLQQAMAQLALVTQEAVEVARQAAVVSTQTLNEVAAMQALDAMPKTISVVRKNGKIAGGKVTQGARVTEVVLQ